ncbi:MAG: 1-acyl-sn-glycerol-3-phosphate acyltransferase [bacterium]|nr:1-acyl-sn-glycerol-3-phosphate acyltransferase [bacterium]
MEVKRIKPFFKSRYRTPKNRRRELGDILFGTGRFWFYLRFAAIVIKASIFCRFGKYNDNKWSKSSYGVLRALEGSQAKFDIEGLEHLAACKEPVVIIGNHMSSLETVVLPCLIAPLGKVTFVTKASLMKSPFFGTVLSSRSPIVVGRNNPREDLTTVLEQGAAALKSGMSVIIFPQSTRKTMIEPKEFNSLGVKLALRAGVKVIPLALKTDFWGTSKKLGEFGPLNRKCTVHFEFAPPMDVTERGKKQHQDIIDFISSRVERWTEEDS